jgi:tail tube protein gp19
MSNFHIESRLKNAKDPIRTFFFEVIIPHIDSVTDSFKDSEDLVTRVRSVNVPSRGNEPIDSYFMGMKQKFPGKPTFTNTISITFEDFEDQKVSLAMYEWANRIFDIRSNSPTGGMSQATKKRDIAKDIIIKQYAYGGEISLKFQYHLFNCFIENVDEIQLEYNSNDTVKVPVTFSFDYFEIEKSNT